MKFGRVRFRVKKLIVSDLNAAMETKNDASVGGGGAGGSACNNNNRLSLDLHDRRLSEMNIG